MSTQPLFRSAWASAPHAPRQMLFRAWLSESLERQRALTWFGLLIWAAMIPGLLAWGLDDRTLRGVNVWVKPLKFMASLGLFALFTAWFVGLLPVQQRRRPAVRLVVWTIIGAGLFEIVYITLQAALGTASHYNADTRFHSAMYTLMGVAALAMTATQPLLAWQIARHGRKDLPVVWRDAVVLGLVLTFVLGAGSGALLGAAQPPSGEGLPVVGWHLGGGDLRFAHFVGMHSQQWLPLAGLMLLGTPTGRARVALAAVVVAVVAAWLWAVATGLQGAVFVPPGVLRSGF